MATWSIAKIYQRNAEIVPERAALIQGDRKISWRDFDNHANSLACAFMEAGLGHQSKVACYMYNCPEYMETIAASFYSCCVPVNTNYRYGLEEIVYLFDNSDAEAVVFHASFAELLTQARSRLPKVRLWVCVPDGFGQAPDWAVDYNDIVTNKKNRVNPSQEPSGEDMLFLYTGGTTGMPKGVMWRQNELFHVTGAAGLAPIGLVGPESVEELHSRIGYDKFHHISLPVCPMMHGTGMFTSINALTMGGTVVALSGRKFDADELWREIARHKVLQAVIVGMAFAGPMLEWLDAHPNELDFSALRIILSSGVMWSEQNKAGLIKHLPQCVLFDSFGSSEAVGMGASVTTADATTTSTAIFMIGPDCGVFREDGTQVTPGSGEQGLVGVSGNIPVGYYKDEVKTAATFRTYQGKRWSFPGDFAEVNLDGTLRLLGRGSQCINTGGEKVFPEEVEEVLKVDDSVCDAVVVGVPDPRFGESICAVVEPAPNAKPELDHLAQLVKKTLAAYKAPRHLVIVDSIGRAANGKVDYKHLRSVALKQLEL